MPNVSRITSPYILTGNPDTLNVSLAASTDLYAAGELGCTFDSNDKSYCLVLVSTGANSTTATGAILANQVAYWVSKTNRTVTNDIATCLTPAAPTTCVAGIFRVGVPANGVAGNLVCVLTRGNGIPVVSGTVAVGPAMAGLTAGTNAIVTATGTNPVIGIARTTTNPALVDVDIPSLA